MDEKNLLTPVPATSDDIPVLVDHHRRMFEEIIISQGLGLETLNPEKLDREYTKKLTDELGTTCSAWVIQHVNKEVIASGGVSIISMVPVPNDYSYKVAYIHSLFTEKKFRNKGLGGRIMEQVIQFCKEKGMKRLILNASDVGRPLYEKLGFESATNSMRMFIE